ncbi:MAG: tetratricopeptide repeat protein [Pseudomonadota bacterium]|nr:tetratricopeptide repeat protein [Pseudomonadota bacterium]
MIVRRHDIAVAIFFLLALFATYILYSPGLSGGFIFDDFSNLKILGKQGGIDNWEALQHYLSSGFSGPTGRPISYASFLINANNWPADAVSFKYTNILIHLVNGSLLLALFMVVLRFHENTLQLSRRAQWAALVAVVVWLSHPYLVSTTLYVVQRMTQLATLFVLLGLLAWLRGRRLLAFRPRAGYIWMTGGLAIFGLLAIFSKENGALLPCLALALEVTVVGRSRLAGPLSKSWSRLCLAAPTLLIVLYLFYIAFNVGWLSDYNGRDFSPFERLLTQARVVWIYLYYWFVPHAYTTGVFHDQLILSKGLLTPWTTLVAMVGLGVLVGVAYKLRKRWPLYLMSLVFFLASLLLEATTVGLEIFFEHRVYMGSGLLLLPFIYYGFKAVKPSVGIAASAALCAVLMLLCWRGTTLWGNYPLMINVWAQKAPESARAQTELARILYEVGKRQEALEVLETASRAMPQDLQVRLTKVLVQCKVNRATSADQKAAIMAAHQTTYRPTWFSLLQKGLSWSSDPACQGVAPAFITDVTTALLASNNDSPKSSTVYGQLAYLKGVSLLLSGQEEAGFGWLERSLQGGEEPQKLMNIAGFLATRGFEQQALKYAQQAKQKVASGQLYGKALAEAPLLPDINVFITVLESELRDKHQHRHSGQK